MRDWVCKIFVLIGVIGSAALLIVGGKFESAKRALLRFRIRERENELRESSSIVDEKVRQEVENQNVIEKELEDLHARKQQAEEELKRLSNEDIVSELNRRGF